MKTIMYPAISLDGFIARPDGDSYSWVNQHDEARYDAVVEKCGSVLVGRKTYEEYKKDFDSKKGVITFVYSHQKGDESNTVKFVSGDPGDVLSEIEQYGFKEVIICGGGEINGLLASSGLVDEIIISIQPAVLGKGIPLFGTHKPELELELLSTNHDVEGVIQNQYKVLNNEKS